jgi:Domain of unknown function (DUF4136)
MAMKSARWFRLGLAVVALLCCSTWTVAQSVKYNYLPGTDFSKYRTYRWAKIPNVQYPNQIADQQIMRSIDAQLATKGLTRTEGEASDLVLIYQVSVDKETQWNSYSTGGDNWGWGRWGGWGGYGGMSTTTTTSETIRIGTLNLDIYDVAGKQQIWRGEASKTLGSGKNPEKVQKNLDKAMAKLLKNYPPPPKK